VAFPVTNTAELEHRRANADLGHSGLRRDLTRLFKTGDALDDHGNEELPVFAERPDARFFLYSSIDRPLGPPRLKTRCVFFERDRVPP
jgi:hypothetical protein